MRLWDCFPFFRELDLLEIRLEALSPLVDRFVLVESRFDFTGREKPLHYAENSGRFAGFADRIEHVVVETLPPDPGARWAVQRHQRDRLLDGLGDAAPEDIVMVSDLDEIPKPWAVERVRALLTRAPGVVALKMEDRRYRLDLRSPGTVITGTRAVRMRDFGTPHLVRQMKRTYWKGWPEALDLIPAAFNAWRATGRPLRRHVLEDAGWHMSCMGDVDYLAAKRASFETDERFGAAEGWAEKLARLDGAARIGPALGLETAALSDLPAPVSAAPERFAHMLDQLDG